MDLWLLSLFCDDALVPASCCKDRVMTPKWESHEVAWRLSDLKANVQGFEAASLSHCRKTYCPACTVLTG